MAELRGHLMETTTLCPACGAADCAGHTDEHGQAILAAHADGDHSHCVDAVCGPPATVWCRRHGMACKYGCIR